LKNYKGIILAGGYGTRLSPLTKVVSKQLLPVYNKPMIYYPLSTLMLADIREYLIITSEEYLPHFKKLLGDGSKLGITIEYKTQKEPDGLAQAFLIGRDFIGDSNVALILGDNLFHGSEIETKMQSAKLSNQGATIFAYRVRNPERYGVVEFDSKKNVLSLEEKPKNPRSNYAATGIYFYDNNVVEYAKKIKPSPRGEYEITSINEIYLEKENIKVEILGRGTAWLDTGTFDSLFQAGNFIRTIELRQGLQVGCPEEVSWRKGWISSSDLEKIMFKESKSSYGNYLLDLLKDKL
jgi:glucose-1-phosphate thymidylyltransferase